MQLWTWQKKGFSLSDPKGQVESPTHSDYYEEHKEIFERLWEILGTSQLLWCFVEKEEAMSKASELEYKGKVLWELDVPAKHICHNVCSIAWHWILHGCRCHLPVKLRRCWKEKFPNRFRELENKFHHFFGRKTREELWEALVLDGIVTDCTTPLICYPVREAWIKGNTPWENVKFRPYC